MQDLNVSLVQANQIWEDKSANFNNYSRLLEGIQTDLILLPEMFHTGFSMAASSLSETMTDSEGVHWLQELAREKEAAVYTSLIIKDNDFYYNRGVFIYSDGRIETYDKRKTFSLAGEDKTYRSGNKPQIVDYNGWKINLQICYDLRFPEMARNCIREDGTPLYDMLLYVANWPDKRIAHWDALLPARAIENQCYVAAVNRVGTDHNALSYTGHSMVIDALGKESKVPLGQECVAQFVINYNDLVKIREMLPFLKDA